MFPLAGPADAGENCTENVKFWLGKIVTGRASPLTPKPVPVTVARFTTRLALPEFVSVTLCVPLLPMVTFPKLMEADERDKPVCIPIPVKETEIGELEALLVIERLPEIVPSEAGEKLTVSVDELPALIVAGNVIPLSENAEPATEVAETVRSALPELLIVTVIVPLLPTATFPKFTVVLLRASCGAGATG
jgi:hypothetical protein